MNSSGSHDWTEERIDLLKKLWADGLSCSQIAARIGGGLSRSAIIGKVRRLKLKGRSDVALKLVQKRQAAANRPVHQATPRAAVKAVAPPVRVKPAPVRLVVDNADGPGVPFLDIAARGQCRWPLWGLDDHAVEDLRYCGHATAEGQTYCERHRRRSIHHG